MSREAISKKLRFQVLTRDRFCCRYCGAKAGDAKLHIDHRVPVSKGGRSVIENLYTACQPCNLGKGVMDVEDVPIPHVVMLELKFLEGAHFALGHSELPYKFWSFLVGYYESGGDLTKLRSGITEQMKDNEADLQAAYPTVDDNFRRPSYLRAAQAWVSDPVWLECVSDDQVEMVRAWGRK